MGSAENAADRVWNLEFPDQGAWRSGTLYPAFYRRGQNSVFFDAEDDGTGSYPIRGKIAYPEILPQSIMQKYHFMPRKQAIATIHQPQDTRDGSQGRERMVYEELFLFQLKMQAYRALNRSRMDGIVHTVDNKTMREFVRSLPFELTDAQKKVELEILQDMRSPYCMNRLLQGDVGSGKTVIAAIALYGAVRSVFQGALMVPTEILAQGAYAFLAQKLFEPFGISVGLLTGSIHCCKRKDLLGSLQMGMTDIVSFLLHPFRTLFSGG